MIEEKITKLRELLAKRDELDHEIAALFEAPDTTLKGEPRQRRPKEEQTWSLKIHCKNCGKEGHRSDSVKCPKNQRREKTIVLDAPPKPKKYKTPPLTREQFAIIKDMKAREMFSKEVSDQMNLPLSEVNLAFNTSNYEHYEELHP